MMTKKKKPKIADLVLPSCIHCESSLAFIVEVIRPDGSKTDMFAATLGCDFCSAHGPVVEGESMDAVKRLALKAYNPDSTKVGRKYKQAADRKY